MENHDTDNDGDDVGTDDITNSSSTSNLGSRDGEQGDGTMQSSSEASVTVSVNQNLVEGGLSSISDEKCCGSSDQIPAEVSGPRGREDIPAISSSASSSSSSRRRSQDAVRMESSRPTPQLQDPPSARPPLSNVSTTVCGGKRKRLHADAQDCLDLARTGPGAAALRNPSQSETGSSPTSRSCPRGVLRSPETLSPSSTDRARDWMMRNPTSPEGDVPRGSPRMQAVPRGVSPQGFHQRPRQPSASGLKAAPTVFPKKNLFGYVDSWDPARQRNSQEGDHRRCRTTATSQPKDAGTVQADSWTSAGQPSSQRGEATAARSDVGQNHPGPNKRPSSPAAHSPAKRLGEAARLTPVWLPGSSGGTPTKCAPRGSVHPSPARSTASTTESDIEDFQNDSSWDRLDFDDLALATPMADPQPSEKGRPAVDRDIEAFECDSFFDDMDPGLLNGERAPSGASNQASDNCSSSSSNSRGGDAGSCPYTYGLLGEGSSAVDSELSSSLGFADLPVEVLERIFCFVPMPDLCLRLSSVCKLWHRIISKPDFIPWKKAYFRLRMTSLTEVAEQLCCITHDETETEDSCLLNLVRNMPKFKARYSPVMDKDLQKHPLYALARDVMKAKAPQVWTGEAPNSWATIALLAVLSERVKDVLHILECLLHRTASCTTMEVLESLYCTAAYLWKYRLRFKLNSGLHYRVFHAFQLYENSHSCINVTPNDQPTVEGALTSHLLPFRTRSFPPTHEQSRIINYDVPRGKAVKIVAFAGTGKTTTLVKYAERRPNVSFLYVAFNKNVMQYATEIFPSNVSSRTTHSLAYETVGRKYKEKLQSSLSPLHIHRALPPGQRKELPWLRHASLVCRTLERFCASADEFITTQHVPVDYLKNMRERHPLNHPLRMKISNDASAIWKKMIDVKNKDVHITHDGYLKLFQLGKPWAMNYDCLLIDEAQDLTPAQQDILLNQQSAKILVGDPHQQIYSFRGAVNSMDRIQSQRTFYLTQSFRFGTEIAYIANCLLETGFPNLAQMRQMLIGSSLPDCIDGRQKGRLAVITRSNLMLFNEAARIVKADETTTLGFAGGIERLKMDVILDIYQLLQPSNKRGHMRNSHINKHKSLPALKKYSLESDNVDLMNKVKIVEMHSVNIPSLVELIERRTRPSGMADIVLSTAHTAKGLEFDTVKITDDFGISMTALTPLVVLQKDELNMVYVAITRAKRSLVLNSSLMAYIRGPPCLEKFAYPVSGFSARGQQDSPVVCTACQEAVPKDCPMLLKTKALKTAYPSITKQEGVLCPQCSVEFYPPYRCFFDESHLHD